PDVLVSDIGMPGMDGYEFIRELRSRAPERGGHVAALALTAFARLEDVARARANGYDGHISKPVNPKELAMTPAPVFSPACRPGGGYRSATLRTCRRHPIWAFPPPLSGDATSS